MKKTIFLGILALATLSVQAQKKTKLKKFDPTTAIQTKTDSLSYALGQNITQGLRDHLVTTGVLKDSTATDFDAKANSTELQLFIDGLIDALATVDPKEEKYNAGLAIGNQLTSVATNFETEMLDGAKMNKDAFINSIVSSIKGEPSALPNPQEYFQQAMMIGQEAKERKKAEELKIQHAETISAGTKFLAENKTKQGVVELPSGLQYKKEIVGTGATPSETDRVTVHYEGRLLDGTVFDSSYKRGEPTTFGVTQVIAGWIEALQLMPAGSKWTIYVPQNLAYGERDGGPIPPFSTLVFDIELIEIAQ